MAHEEEQKTKMITHGQFTCYFKGPDGQTSGQVQIEGRRFETSAEHNICPARTCVRVPSMTVICNLHRRRAIVDHCPMQSSTSRIDNCTTLKILDHNNTCTSSAGLAAEHFVPRRGLPLKGSRLALTLTPTPRHTENSRTGGVVDKMFNRGIVDQFT